MPEPLSATIGWSDKADALQAGREAARAAMAKVSVRSPRFAFVFGSSWFDQWHLLQGVRVGLGTTPLIGGSTAGEIIPDGPISHSCVVLLITSELLTWGVGAAEQVERAPREAGQRAAYVATRSLRSTQRIGFILFGDGLVTNFADVVRGIQEVVGTSSLIAGAMAGDDLRFAQTSQYVNDRVLSGGVVGVLLGGTGTLGIGMGHGFAPISKPRAITRAQANVILELDHHPAASVYEEYFGADLVAQMRHEGPTRQTIAYPLGIKCEETDQWLLRNVVSFREDGSLACSGEIPEGAWLQLMISSKGLALEAARTAAQEAIRPLSRVAAVLVFDSISRRRLLGERHAAMEIAVIRQTIGSSVPLAGCYTYGEQAPVGMTSVSGRTGVQTGSVLVIALGG